MEFLKYIILKPLQIACACVTSYAIFVLMLMFLNFINCFNNCTTSILSFIVTTCLFVKMVNMKIDEFFTYNH